MKLKVEMSITEYEKFLEKYFPDLYKIYSFMVEDMARNSCYGETSIKVFLLNEIVPLVNEKLEEISKKKGD